MDIKNAWFLLIGLFAGLGAGWFAAAGRASRPAETELLGPDSPASRETTTSATDLHSPLHDLETLQDFARHRFVDERSSRRRFEALALLYAVTGRTGDLEALIDRALEEGVEPGRLFRAIRSLPERERGRVMIAVLDRHPGAAFDPYDVARLLADADESSRALSVLRDALPEMEGFDGETIHLLLELDPARGPDLLFGLESASDWSGSSLKALRAYLVDVGQERRLVPFLERALDARPDDTTALRTMAKIAPEAALARLRDRLAADDRDYGSWALVGRIHEAQGDDDDAFEAYRKAAEHRPTARYFENLLDLDPEKALPLIEAWTEGATDDEAIGARARAYRKAGREAEALETYLRAHANDPDDGDWVRGMIRLDPARAAQVLKERVAGGATDERSLGHYADALRAADRKAEAFDQYLAAHRKDPDDHAWQASMAEVDPTRALPILDRHVKAYPDDASGRGAYGMALASAGRTDEALAHMDYALAEGDAETWYDRMAEISPERALDALRRRAEHDRRDDEIWGTLGEVLLENGRRDEAREAFRRAVTLDPTDSTWVEALRDTL